MGRISVPLIVGSARDQPFCCESAAFLNESMIREIITGRYLQLAVNRSNKGGYKLDARLTRHSR